MKFPGHTVRHAFKYLMWLESPHTQTTEKEREVLLKYAKNKKLAVEIGVYEGFTTAILASSLHEEGVLFAIDPFFSGRTGICWSKLIAKQHVKKMRVKDKIKFIEHFSFDAVKIISGSFDFIFIDGDHSLEGIERDWNDWANRLMPSGIMALHDTKIPKHNPNVANLGSYKYFETTIKHDTRFEIIEQIDSLSILRRK